MRPTCKSCAAFDSTGHQEGLCRFYPPDVVTNVSIGHRAVWPKVGVNDWCTDHQTFTRHGTKRTVVEHG